MHIDGGVGCIFFLIMKSNHTTTFLCDLRPLSRPYMCKKIVQNLWNQKLSLEGKGAWEWGGGGVMRGEEQKRRGTFQQHSWLKMKILHCVQSPNKTKNP